MKKYRVYLVRFHELEAKLNELSKPKVDLQVLVAGDSEALIICTTTLNKRSTTKTIEPRTVNPPHKLDTFYQAV